MQLHLLRINGSVEREFLFLIPDFTFLFFLLRLLSFLFVFTLSLSRCWAFSAIGSIEGARYIKTGNLTDLSMQQLLDCDMTDLGCFGGLMDQAFQYDEDAVGLCSAQDYPYAYHRHWFWGCERYAPYCSPLPYTKVKKYVNVTKTEEALKAAIATQPVSVAVAAGGTSWQFYKSGVYDVGCEHNEKGEPAIDHGVLAVGYGHYDPTTDPSATAGGVASDYFLIKNSWGENWGMNGCEYL